MAGEFNSQVSKWFVVHTYSGYENKVKSNIMTVVKNKNMQDQILDVMIPTKLVVSSKEVTTRDEDDKPQVERVETQTERKVMPGYVFIKVACVDRIRTDSHGQDYSELSLSDEAWYIIRNTRGVTGFVGPDGKPQPLTEDEVYRLGIQEKTVDFKVGDYVEIVDGPMSGFAGPVSKIDIKNDMVEVLVDMLGRDTPTQVSITSVVVKSDY